MGKTEARRPEERNGEGAWGEIRAEKVFESRLAGANDQTKKAGWAGRSRASVRAPALKKGRPLRPKLPEGPRFILSNINPKKSSFGPAEFAKSGDKRSFMND